MTITELNSALKQGPVAFNQVMDVIDTNYDFTPTAFANGNTTNEANTNNGSCKVFSYAQLNQLDEQSTLNAFGDFYTKDVLENTTGDDHQNIRNFIEFGWSGIKFEGSALKAK